MAVGFRAAEKAISNQIQKECVAPNRRRRPMNTQQEAVRILFINPPLSQVRGNVSTNLKFPLGFLYLATPLERDGFGVKILDAPLHYRTVTRVDDTTVRIGMTFEQIAEEIRSFAPRIIGVSCAFTMCEADSFAAIDFIKQRFPSVLLVVGGAHTSANPGYVLRNRNIDLAVIGEGELTMLEIARRFRSGQALQDIRGTALVSDGQVRTNEPRDYMANLDEYGASWHLLDMAQYFAHPYNSNATMRRNAVDLVTSRGCPGRCVFCSIHTVWGRKWRPRTPGNVVDEMEMLCRQYGARQFRIQDDNLTLDKRRIMEICDEIIRRKLDIRWDTPNGIALWTLNEDVLKKMRQAGCYRVTFGIESACARTQQYIGKIVDLQRIRDAVECCHRIGLWVCGTFIIGFPHETLEEIRETERFILKSGFNFPFLYVAQPMQGTRLYEDFKAHNLLPDNFRQMSSVGQTRYDTLHFKWYELNSLLQGILLKFYAYKTLSYLNPVRLYREFVSKIRSWEDCAYVLRMAAEIWKVVLVRKFSERHAVDQAGE